MSQVPRRRRAIVPFTSPVEYDADRVIDQLFPQPLPQAPRRRIRRIVRDGDGAVTAVDYYVTVHPGTGEQRVDVRVLTNKRECARCGRMVSRLYECEDCRKKICGLCLTSRKVFLGDKPVCLTCASLRDC